VNDGFLARVGHFIFLKIIIEPRLSCCQKKAQSMAIENNRTASSALEAA
jgi:hypothetical protein